METDLINYLCEHPDVNRVVGREVTPGVREQGAPLPAITVNLASAVEDQTYAGVNPLQSSLMQVDCWGETYREAKLVADAVVLAARAMRDPAGTVLQHAFIENKRASSEVVDGKTIFNRSLDLRIWHDA